ncbi:MCL1 protein, partial [Urocolius indicus]|nr:MCL1 protein [Urocolius indicus]
MFAVRRNALIGFNLYCGGGGGGGSGGGGPAMAPASAAGGPAPPPPPPSAAAAAELPPRAVPGSAPCAAAIAAPSPPPEAPPSLIGCGATPRSLIGSTAAPRSLIGCGAAPHAALSPGSLWSPEEELDGCEPEPQPQRGPAARSLPASPPELPDGLRRDSLELISRYLKEAAGEAEPAVKKLLPGLFVGPGRPGAAGHAAMDKALETLRRVGNGVMQKHELAFQGMLRKLEIQKEEDLQSVCEVAAHLFSDGVTNWGRVVTLISFGAFVAKHLKSIKQEKCINSLAGIITDALVSSKREWLLSQGGWEGFVDFFRVEDLEGSIRNILMAFAGVAGLGASLAYMIR